MSQRPGPLFSLDGPLCANVNGSAGHSNVWPTQWRPLQIKPWFVAILAGLFIALAVGIEVAYAFSIRNEGFDASDDPWSLSSTQFLTSFLSTLLITPLVFLLGKQDETTKLLQPYVDLAESTATAERSLMLDYITANSIQSIYRGTINRHGVIVVSATACVIANLLQPLAGSLFTIRPTEVIIPQKSALANTQLGLVSDFGGLDAFVAAAGFAEAAAFHNLSDPPFIHETWAVTEFEIPQGSNGNNGSATIQTVGVRSEPHCEPAPNVQLSGPDANGNYTLIADFTNCRAQVAINGRNGDDSGVQAAAGCGGPANANPSRAGAAFWYFLANPVNATVVLCNPQVEVFNVAASVNATTNQLYDVTIIDNYPQQNNVTQFLSGGALNGIAFDTADFPQVDTNTLVFARAVATSTQVPEAALKLALKERDILQQYPDFLGITVHIYQQYLAIVAKSIFFQDFRVQVPATVRQYQARLWLDPLSCHSLAAILCLTALMIVYAQWSHHQTRNRIYLACPPGTIASAITVTSNSRWTSLIGPADDQASVIKKLRGMRFRLDPITHHIIVEGEALGQPRNSVPPNSPMLDPRISVYSTSTKGSPLPTPGENKHFSFQGAGNAMVQSRMSAQPFLPPQPYAPQPPPENQGLLSPYQRVESYHDAAGAVHPVPYGMPSPTIPRSS